MKKLNLKKIFNFNLKKKLNFNKLFSIHYIFIFI